MTRTNSACALGHLAIAVLVALLTAAGPLSAAEPRVPAAPAPDGVAVAVLGPGVDYRVPLVRDRFARDGEGDLIGWDFADGDNRPFEQARAGRGTPYAVALLNANPAATLVIVREKPGDPQAFGHMMSFVVKTPARIVVWPDARPVRPDWPILVEAVNRFRHHLFIVPREEGGRPLPYAALVGAPNVILVDVAQAPTNAPSAAPALFAAAGRAAQELAANAARPIAEFAAVVRNAIAASANARQPAVVPNRSN
jgi:hypothetical protein